MKHTILAVLVVLLVGGCATTERWFEIGDEDWRECKASIRPPCAMGHQPQREDQFWATRGVRFKL